MRLAVLIPAFDAAAALQRTLASLASDLEPFDVVVVDDGSSPPLTAPETAGDHRVVMLRHERNRGVAHALNTGLAWIDAHGYDAVARLDAGDMNHPDRLRVQRAYLAAHPNVVLVGAWTCHVDEQMLPLYITRYPGARDGILRCFHYRSSFSHPASMLRIRVLRQVGPYDPRWHLGEDYDLFWRVAARFPCANIPKVLVTRVESVTSLTHSRRLAMGWTRIRLQWRHFTWRRADCWLGIMRSVALLCLPARASLLLKRSVGEIG